MGELRVVDLFSGLGGFSAGAIDAGAKVVLGIDDDHEVLSVYGKNFPGAAVRLAHLGPSNVLPPLPAPSPWLHVHASPPGADLSSARHSASDHPKGVKRSSSVMDRVSHTGEEMLRWSLDLVLARNDASWTVETLMGPRVRNLLDDYVGLVPDRVAYASFDACHFGAAQSRTRIIAGPPALIHELKQMLSSCRVTVRTLFDEHNIDLPSEYVKNQTRDRHGKASLRSVEEQSFTICASHPLAWAKSDASTVRMFSPEESALLFGFPANWHLPAGQRVAHFAVGNSMCVSVGAAIAKAAIAVAKTVTEGDAVACDECEHAVSVEVVDEDELKSQLDAATRKLHHYEKCIQRMEHTFNAQIHELRRELGVDSQSVESQHSGGKRTRR